MKKTERSMMNAEMKKYFTNVRTKGHTMSPLSCVGFGQP